MTTANEWFRNLKGGTNGSVVGMLKSLGKLEGRVTVLEAQASANAKTIVLYDAAVIRLGDEIHKLEREVHRL